MSDVDGMPLIERRECGTCGIILPQKLSTGARIVSGPLCAHRNDVVRRYVPEAELARARAEAENWKTRAASRLDEISEGIEREGRARARIEELEAEVKIQDGWGASIRAQTVAEIVAWLRVDDGPTLPERQIADKIEREFPAPVQADTEETA